jgi:hypothetical protein
MLRLFRFALALALLPVRATFAMVRLVFRSLRLVLRPRARLGRRRLLG